MKIDVLLGLQWGDECSYDEQFLNCIVYGMIAEFLCTQCFYEESIAWEKKYKKEISNLYN